MQTHSMKSTLAAPDRILVATDLTDTGYLMPYVIAQAKASGAQVTLIHALPPSEVVPMDGAVIPYVDMAKTIRDTRVMLLGVARELESQGITCDTVVRDGAPTDVIVEELRRTKASRLIMGSHGRGQLGQLTLGSVAHDLIPNVNVPVFVVGPCARTGVQQTTPRRILHPVSFMGGYRESLHLALDIAKAYQAELILLHVLDRDLNPSTDPEKTIQWAKDALEALIPDTTGLSAPIHTTVTSGELTKEILKVADRAGADWIVLGADGGIRVWPFNESAAYKVLTAANCPVLTLRHEPVRTEAAVNLEEVHFTSPL